MAFERWEEIKPGCSARWKEDGLEIITLGFGRPQVGRLLFLLQPFCSYGQEQGRSFPAEATGLGQLKPNREIYDQTDGLIARTFPHRLKEYSQRMRGNLGAQVLSSSRESGVGKHQTGSELCTWGSRRAPEALLTWAVPRQLQLEEHTLFAFSWIPTPLCSRKDWFSLVNFAAEQWPTGKKKKHCFDSFIVRESAQQRVPWAQQFAMLPLGTGGEERAGKCRRVMVWSGCS